MLVDTIRARPMSVLAAVSLKLSTATTSKWAQLSKYSSGWMNGCKKASIIGDFT